MTPDELNEIEARCKAATAAPWELTYVTVPHADGSTHREPNVVMLRDEHGRCVRDPFTMTKQDAAFIAAARTDVPKLVAEIRRLQGENRELAVFRAIHTPGAIEIPGETNVVIRDNTFDSGEGGCEVYF